MSQATNIAEQWLREADSITPKTLSTPRQRWHRYIEALADGPIPEWLDRACRADLPSDIVGGVPVDTDA